MHGRCATVPLHTHLLMGIYIVEFYSYNSHLWELPPTETFPLTFTFSSNKLPEAGLPVKAEGKTLFHLALASHEGNTRCLLQTGVEVSSGLNHQRWTSAPACVKACVCECELLSASLCSWMCVHMHMWELVHVCICVCMCEHVHKCIHMSMCTSVHAHVCIWVCEDMRVSTCR